MKFLDKLRKVGKKGKALICTVMATVSAAAITVCASAAETGETTGIDTAAVMKEAGDSLTNSFAAIVKTMIPVILGILGSAIVIYGVIALVKLGKRIFGKVAG